LKNLRIYGIVIFTGKKSIISKGIKQKQFTSSFLDKIINIYLIISLILSAILTIVRIYTLNKYFHKFYIIIDKPHNILSTLTEYR